MCSLILTGEKNLKRINFKKFPFPFLISSRQVEGEKGKKKSHLAYGYIKIFVSMTTERLVCFCEAAAEKSVSGTNNNNDSLFFTCCAY